MTELKLIFILNLCAHTASNTSLAHSKPQPTLKISGKSATSTSTLTGMPRETKLETAGTLPANMESVNARAILLRHAPSSFTTDIPKPFPSLFASRPTQVTGLPKARSAPTNLDLTGTPLALAPHHQLVSTIWLKWPPLLKIFSHLTPMFHGLSSMELTHKAPSQP